MTFNKIIFEMKLYSVKHQIEALEKLVNKGFYDADLLKNAYEEYFKNYEIIQKLDSTIKPSNKNSLDMRVGLYYLVNNTLSEIDRAKYLNLLWIKAKEANIDKAICSLTNNALSTLVPKKELNWFIYPATKTLINLKKIEEAKQWLFFMLQIFIIGLH